MIIKPLLKPTSAVTSEASKVKVTLPITSTYLFTPYEDQIRQLPENCADVKVA